MGDEVVGDVSRERDLSRWSRASRCRLCGRMAGASGESCIDLFLCCTCEFFVHFYGPNDTQESIEILYLSVMIVSSLSSLPLLFLARRFPEKRAAGISHGCDVEGRLVDRAVGSRAAHTSVGSKKIVGVFYQAGEYADKNPNFVGCVEGALGIRNWLESKGPQYIVTDDKEGLNSDGFISLIIGA